jgi:formylglycine-generating enzyme required for sulfatase activity
MEKEKWTSGEIESRLENLFDDIGELKSGTPLQQSYREAASVLASFNPAQLEAAGVVQDRPQSIDELLGSTELASVSAEDEKQWTIAPDIRRESLKRLVTENRVQETLFANTSRPQNLVQQTLEAGLLGRSKPLDQQNVSELLASLQVSDWLDGILPVPRIDEIQQRIEKETLLKPFRDLVGERFAGREEQLDQLSDYVGVYEASGTVESAHRLVESVLSIRRRPPLMIVAPGGMGKSALIAQFILIHDAAQYVRRFPFAYLDFDRPGLIPEEPVTLLLEAVRQFAVQFPQAKTRAKDLRKEWQQKIREVGAVEVLQVPRVRSRSGNVRGAALKKSSEERAARVVRFRDREWFYGRFADFISEIRPTNSPVLLVLDTFEEVQYRGTPFVEGIFDFLDTIQSRIPELRTMLAGRVEVKSPKYSVRQLKLPPFDRAAAQAFLEKLGLTNVELGFAIADQVGGSPLTLKLAARLVKVASEEVGPEGIRRLDTGIFALLKGKSIEAQLYYRILDHIHDKEVRKLAHPGLILRRITVDLIEKVLAEPCGVDVTGPGRAGELFDKLAKEIAIVEGYGPGVLMHRPDVRALSLRMLIEDEKMKHVARKINEGAIHYYSVREGSESRAEELYHLLLFDLERERTEPRADDPAALLLVVRSIDELPERSQAFVAGRINIERSDLVWQKADLEDWELRTAHLAQECLAMHKAQEAISLISQRTARTLDSPLYVIEVDALIEIGDTRTATKKVGEFLSLPTISASTTLDLELRRARLAFHNVPLIGEQARKTLELLYRAPKDLRIVEWMLLAIPHVMEFFTRSFLTEQLRRVQREIPVDMWKENEDLQKRVQDILLLKDPGNQPLVDVSVSTSVLYRDDPRERYGPFVLTRGEHVLTVPPLFRMGVYPVTNEQFLAFINAQGYLNDALWEGASRVDFLTRDNTTLGPATWLSQNTYPAGQGNHPVTGVSYLEASAFVKWLNREFPDPEWIWCLPSEDMWELSARSPQGFQYPWGAAFLQGHCNSVESGINGTSDVGMFPEGDSPSGCADLAGNVWEFVEDVGRVDPRYCVLRGGSFKNNEHQVKSYLQLVGVQIDHRPPDFGLRCAQLLRKDSTEDSEQKRSGSAAKKKKSVKKKK